MLATANGNFRDDYYSDSIPDPLADLTTADSALDEATSALAGAWAALRQAKCDPLAGPLVAILAQLRGIRDQVASEVVAARDAAGREPADWFQEN